MCVGSGVTSSGDSVKISCVIDGCDRLFGYGSFDLLNAHCEDEHGMIPYTDSVYITYISECIRDANIACEASSLGPTFGSLVDESDGMMRIVMSNIDKLRTLKDDIVAIQLDRDRLKQENGLLKANIVELEK